MEKTEMPHVLFNNVSKNYQMGEVTISALKDVSFEIRKGELCIILGPSGAGKSTILNILGGMETVTSGKVYSGYNDITAMNDFELTNYRRYDIGFVFQFYNLIPNLTALENVELAQQVCKSPLDAVEALRMVGLNERINNFPAQLSGGEQQRVAVARAICKNPELMLCDEPTGALDTVKGKDVLKALSDISRVMGKTVVIITHNSLLSAIADRVIKVKNGRIEEQVTVSCPKSLEDIQW